MILGLTHSVTNCCLFVYIDFVNLRYIKHFKPTIHTYIVAYQTKQTLNFEQIRN